MFTLSLGTKWGHQTSQSQEQLLTVVAHYEGHNQSPGWLTVGLNLNRRRIIHLGHEPTGICWHMLHQHRFIYHLYALQNILAENTSNLIWKITCLDRGCASSKPLIFVIKWGVIEIVGCGISANPVLFIPLLLRWESNRCQWRAIPLRQHHGATA